MSMYADISRWTHDATSNRRRVVFQQGRIGVDADLNEASAIVLDEIRALTAALVGPYGAAPGAEPPTVNDSFAIDASGSLGSGTYWAVSAGTPTVALRCVNLDERSIDQKFGQVLPGPGTSLTALEAGQLVVLDAWERYVSAEQDPHDAPASTADAAFAGIDTSGRSEVVWCIRRVTGVEPPADSASALVALLAALEPADPGSLSAWAKQDATNTDPCSTSPDAAYVGPENQLYRVEILQGSASGAAKFVWSRDNGSVVYPVAEIAGTSVTLARPARDARTKLQLGDWVEVVDTERALGDPREERPRILHQVAYVDECDIELSSAPVTSDFKFEHELTTVIRRWDSRETDDTTFDSNTGGIAISTDPSGVLLEDGIYVAFSGTTFRQGDYWLIPARVATGDVEWPRGADGTATPVPPHGVAHYYAPLALMPGDGGALVGLRHQLPVAGLV